MLSKNATSLQTDSLCCAVFIGLTAENVSMTEEPLCALYQSRACEHVRNAHDQLTTAL